MQSDATQPSNGIRFTSHAQMRSQQRGLRESHLNVVYDFADLELHVGGSCRRLSISARELRRLVNEGLLAPKEAERCKNVSLIVDGGTLITAYRH